MNRYALSPSCAHTYLRLEAACTRARGPNRDTKRPPMVGEKKGPVMEEKEKKEWGSNALVNYGF
jgi:hypothetical protein